MRQGQQNRRNRGRNRKGQSPLTRSFESTGPDVKIRGTPAHIGEKYMSLARDAAAAGDPVLAENYLQHAEHYNRIIMAAREQFAQGGPGENANGSRFQSFDGDEMDGDDFADDGDGFSGEQPRFADPPQQARPYEGGQGQNYGRRDERPFRRNNNDFRQRDRQGEQRHNQQDRQGQNPRFQNDRFGGDRDRNYGDRDRANERPPVERAAPAVEQPTADLFVAQPAAREEPQPRRRYQPADQQHEQPEFLRRPVRRPRREANGVEGDAPQNGAAASEEPGAD